MRDRIMGKEQRAKGKGQRAKIYSLIHLFIDSMKQMIKWINGFALCPLLFAA
jgi:hypothetical protein